MTNAQLGRFALAYIVIAVSAVLLLTGCTRPQIAEWQTKVKPEDPAPGVCVDDVDRPPWEDMPAGEKDDDQSAKEYAKLKKYTRNLIAERYRCRIWTKGQRQ